MIKNSNAGTAMDMFYGIVINGNTEDNSHVISRQPETKPSIDDVICHAVDGEMLKDALFVIDNIRENNMKIKWAFVNVWSVKYKGKHVCDLRIENGSLVIGPVSGVLTTRVKVASRSKESLAELIAALRDSMAGAQKVSYAMQ